MRFRSLRYDFSSFNHLYFLCRSGSRRNRQVPQGRLRCQSRPLVREFRDHLDWLLGAPKVPPTDQELSAQANNSEALRVCLVAICKEHGVELDAMRLKM